MLFGIHIKNTKNIKNDEIGSYNFYGALVMSFPPKVDRAVALRRSMDGFG